MQWQKASSQIIIRRQKILNMRKFSQIIQICISQIRLIVKSKKKKQKNKHCLIEFCTVVGEKPLMTEKLRKC